jgi:hypothetical protein
MTAFALFAFLCGAVLAFRFKVTILYPIIALGTAIALTLGITAGLDAARVGLTVVSSIVALQIGYLFGGFVRGTLIATRLAARRRHAEPVRDNARMVELNR